MNNGKRYGDIYLLGCDGIYNQKSDLWVCLKMLYSPNCIFIGKMVKTVDERVPYVQTNSFSYSKRTGTVME